jgi:glycosyltransferase involved in cell wall biosynthesis
MIRENLSLKNILYAESGSGYGGSSVSLSRLLNALDRRKYNPVVAALGIGPPIKRLMALGIKTTVIPRIRIDRESALYSTMKANGILGNLLYYSFFAINTIIGTSVLCYLIIKHDIHLVHLNNGLNENLDALFAATVMRLPCISHVRGTVKIMKLERLVSGLVDRIIVTNKDVLRMYCDELPRTKTLLIYNGIEVSSIIPLSSEQAKFKRKKIGLSDTIPIVGTVGRLVRGKGVEDFLKAAQLVKSGGKNVIFMVVGDDPDQDKGYEAHLKTLAHNLGLSDKVIFTGWRDDITELMSMMTLVVQAATYPEGFGLTLIEAMSLKKPLVVTRISGFMDVVEDGASALVVPPGRPVRIAESIKLLLNDESLRKRLGSNGRQRVGKLFDIKLTARGIESVYGDFLPQNFVH